MKKFIGFLMLGLCCTTFTACEFGDSIGTPNGEENLSNLYLQSRTEESVSYNLGSNVVSIKSTTSNVFTYEENRVVREVLDYAAQQYNGGEVVHSQTHHEEVNYSWNGLACTQEWQSGNVVEEYLDDTYLRVKKLETGNYKQVREYDGKKIINEYRYLDGELQYEIEYEYDGLTATFTQTNHILESPDMNGIQMWCVGGKVTYLDDTYLRTAYQEVEYANDFGDRHKVLTTNTYNGTQLVESEVRIEGSYRGYQYDDNAIVSLAEYEWDGLKCTGTVTNYHQDPQPPYNEHNGVVSGVTNVEMTYLK